MEKHPPQPGCNNPGEMISMSKTAIVALALCLFCSWACLGQEPQMTTLKGIIINGTTGEPIGYATIGLSANGINTMSNEEGQFIFKIPAGDKDGSMYISHVGFKPITISIKTSPTGFLTIRLEENIHQLPEVVVKTTNALDMINKAIAKIPDNYQTTPYLTTGFYRMTGTAEKSVIDLSEAAFEIFNGDYARKNKQFKLIKSRVDKDKEATAFDEHEYLYLGQSADAILHEDIVSEVDEPNLLNENRLKLYDFTFNGMVDYNGREAYEIGFDQKDGVMESNRKGKLLLDANDLAFLEFDYSLSPKGLKYWKIEPEMQKRLDDEGVKLDMIGNKVIVTYTKYGGKYYLHHVLRTSNLHLSGGKKFHDYNPLVVKVDYLVTRIDTAGVNPFRNKDVLASNKSIEKQAGSASDDNFWESYNLIQADFNVDSAVSIIRKNNQALKSIK
jgi:CarboxypepD_reg-like domain